MILCTALCSATEPNNEIFGLCADLLRLQLIYCQKLNTLYFSLEFSMLVICTILFISQGIYLFERSQRYYTVDNIEE